MWLAYVSQVCVRVRGRDDLTTMSLDGLITRFREEIAAFQ
jgi:hypothetical protein